MRIYARMREWKMPAASRKIDKERRLPAADLE
jgi:hypothetical protein